MRIRSLHEDEVVARALKQLGVRAKGLEVAAGEDDAAVLRVGRKKLILTCDALLEGVHFRRDWCPPPALGWKALCVNLSDVAAMGGRPLMALVTLGLPPNLSVGWLDHFYRGLGEAARKFGVAIAGGDTVKSPGRIWVDVFVLGECERPLLRKGAKAGDVVAVTGYLGASRAGLEALEEGKSLRALSLGEWEEVVRAHLRPRPRLKEAQILSQCGATALMDLSDGLALDAPRLARASKVKMRIELAKIPVHPVARKHAEAKGQNPEKFAAEGGEDYELLLTLPPEKVPEAKRKLRRAGCPLTMVGEVMRGEGVEFIGPKGKAEKLSASFEHFKTRKV